MFLIILFFMLATVVVLIAGIVLMGKGGKANKKYANRLMVARVVLQAMAVLLLVLMYGAKG